MSYTKHPLNFFPELKEEDFAELVESVSAGYDETFPIILFEGKILDGWNRQRACDEAGVRPAYDTFQGTSGEALELVIRSNKRRNLNAGQKGQLADLAKEAREKIAEAVETERREKISKARKGETSQKNDSSQNKRKTDQKLGEAFGVNRNYVNQAGKIREASPEIADKVLNGTMTHQDAMREVRKIPTNPWLDDEKERKHLVMEGQSVVANAERDKNLIQWAEKEGLAVRVDRGSKFGNPFVMGEDGTRDQVCDAYRDHYLPHKPSILKRLPELRGKVLVCHCYPERCHGEELI